MLLLMIERGMPIDIVLTADTGMEFPEMYDHLAKLDEYLYRERGIHLTISNCSEFVPMEHTKQYLHTDRNGRTTVYQTLPTFIRNSIDHPDSGYSYTENELRKSIELLIKLCR